MSTQILIREGLVFIVARDATVYVCNLVKSGLYDSVWANDLRYL